ncbi:MAG: hypothetical protein Q7S53_03340 [bacterium]|nr:hypothetical protein [bacterium]
MERKILYLEIDEEITSVIDRLKKTAEADIHLVVPKEAALLQSIVNLKLLKRQADTLGKQIQIITHDKVGRNLAEQVGISSASRVGEEAKMPVEPVQEPEAEIQYKEKEPVVEETKEVVFKKGAVLDKSEKEKTPYLPKEEEPKGKGVDKDVQKKKMSELLPKFPHKKFIILASVIGLLLLIFLYVYIPMTNIKIKVLSEKQDMSTTITVDQNTKEVNQSSDTIPGDLITVDKTVTKKYQSTGKKNIGAKAQGTITVKNAYSTLSQTLVAGTRFEANGLVFRTQSDVDVPGYTDSGGGNITPGTANVSAIADSAGDQYNISSSSFRIPAFSGTAKYDKITGSTASAMAGGSTKEVKVVSASDISDAKKAFGDDAKNEIKKEGQDKMKQDETLGDNAQKVTVGTLSVSKSADDEADDFTVSAPTTFRGLAYKKDDLTKVVFEDFKSKTGPNKQILEDKLDGADVSFNDINLEKGTASGDVKASLHLGTKIDEQKLKVEISGQSEQKARDYITHLDGIDSVDMSFFPGFWKKVSRLKSHIYIKTEFAEKQ